MANSHDCPDTWALRGIVVVRGILSTYVGFHRGTADREPAGDLRVAQPFNQQGEHFHFPAGQVTPGQGFGSFVLPKFSNLSEFYPRLRLLQGFVRQR